MCLGLEMMRGGDLKVLGEVDVNHAKISGGKGTPVATNNGKGKGRERVEVETPTDVKVYVDRRCPETTAWFEDTFCREGREGKGVRVEVGGESSQLRRCSRERKLTRGVSPQARRSSSLLRYHHFLLHHLRQQQKMHLDLDHLR